MHWHNRSLAIFLLMGIMGVIALGIALPSPSGSSSSDSSHQDTPILLDSASPTPQPVTQASHTPLIIAASTPKPSNNTPTSSPTKTTPTPQSTAKNSKLSLTSLVSGTVVEGDSNNTPIAHASVFIGNDLSNDISALTDSNGAFSVFDPVLSGLYHVYAQDQATGMIYKPKDDAPVRINESDTTILKLTLYAQSL